MAHLLVHRYSLWIAGTSYFSFANQFFSTDRVSPQTFIAIHDIHVPLNLTKTCTSTLHKFDTQYKRLLCFTEYIFQNIFTQGIAQIRQIFFRQCVYTVNSPNFPAAKVSLHMVCILMNSFDLRCEDVTLHTCMYMHSKYGPISVATEA